MSDRLFRKYQFKEYLNASHSITINGKQGKVHPHTWEFVLDIMIVKKEFTEFNYYEKVINDFFDIYQNNTINAIEPFDLIIPTLENLTEYFGDELRKQLRKSGGELIEIVGSETPTRSYIIDYSNDSDYIRNISEETADSMKNIIDRMLDAAEVPSENMSPLPTPTVRELPLVAAKEIPNTTTEAVKKSEQNTNEKSLESPSSVYGSFRDFDIPISADDSFDDKKISFDNTQKTKPNAKHTISNISSSKKFVKKSGFDKENKCFESFDYGTAEIVPDDKTFVRTVDSFGDLDKVLDDCHKSSDVSTMIDDFLDVIDK